MSSQQIVQYKIIWYKVIDKIIHKFTFKMGFGENILAVGASWFPNGMETARATTTATRYIQSAGDQCDNEST
jgi:hypothetical protein